MARRRHQTGRVFIRGKNPPVFVGCTVAELKTKRIAQRMLDPVLAQINSFDYRPSKFITVGKFTDNWRAQILAHQKPSSRKAVESHLNVYIRPLVGKVRLHELTPQIQQNFVTKLSEKVFRKTVLNRFDDLTNDRNPCVSDQTEFLVTTGRTENDHINTGGFTLGHPLPFCTALLRYAPSFNDSTLWNSCEMMTFSTPS